MTNPCLYTILNVPRNATQDEIKKQFRVLALKHHPDKTGNKDDAETFKKIKDAYDILSDPVKRQIYDISFKSSSQSSNESLEETDWTDFIQKVMTCMTTIYAQYMAEKTNVLNITLNITLDDLYHKRIKKLVVNTVKRDGTPRNATLFISLLNYQEQYKFEGMGDDFKICLPGGKTRGDVIVKLVIQKHDMFTIDTLLTPYDLHMEQKISLYEYMYGTSFEVDLFGSPLMIQYTSGMKVKALENMGLPYYDEEDRQEKRGVLYIFFDIVLPNVKEHPEICHAIACDDTFHDLAQKYLSIK